MPTSEMRAASIESPSPFGSTAASSPAMIWSVREYTVYPPSAFGCQPAIRTGRIDAPGATPCSPSGPSDPVTIPASSVACRSGRPGMVGCGWATAPLPGFRRSMPGRRLSRRYGCDGSTPVSSSATVTPVPSRPGTPSPVSVAGLTFSVSGNWAGYAIRTGYTPSTSRSPSSSASDVGSSCVEKPLTTRTYRYSGPMRAPAAVMRDRNCSWTPSAAPVQARICASVARPPSSRTRDASEG